MKNPSGGVELFNMELVENDSPGAGLSEKGVSTDKIWGKIRARKVLSIDDPRTEKAWIVVFPSRKASKYPQNTNKKVFIYHAEAQISQRK